MGEQLNTWGRLCDLCVDIINEVLTSAENMSRTVIAAAAFGGFCLFLYKVISYYNDGNHEIISKEHVLAIILIFLSFFILPILGVIFVGIYGITNHIAAWQIGLTTPLIIESAYVLRAKKAKKDVYQNKFSPTEEDA